MLKNGRTLYKNKYPCLVPRSTGTKLYVSKCVLKVIREDYGIVITYNARLVFRRDREGDMNQETFALVINASIVRLILSLAAQKGLYVGQLDFLSAFLQAWISRRVYIGPPIFLNVPSSVNWACQLDKSLFGLKDSFRVWHEYLRQQLRNIGFKELTHEQCVLWRQDVLILISIDYILIITREEKDCRSVEKELRKSIPTQDLVPIDHSLVFDVLVISNFVTLKQSKGMDFYVNQKSYSSKSTIPFRTIILLFITQYRYIKYKVSLWFIYWKNLIFVNEKDQIFRFLQVF